MDLDKHEQIPESALDNFFAIERMQMKEDFVVDQVMIEKAYRQFGDKELVDEYVVRKYPDYQSEVEEPGN